MEHSGEHSGGIFLPLLLLAAVIVGIHFFGAALRQWLRPIIARFLAPETQSSNAAVARQEPESLIVPGGSIEKSIRWTVAVQLLVGALFCLLVVVMMLFMLLYDPLTHPGYVRPPEHGIGFPLAIWAVAWIGGMRCLAGMAEAVWPSPRLLKISAWKSIFLEVAVLGSLLWLIAR